MITYISICLILFLIGFRLGIAYILKGLALRVEQIYEEGHYQNARMIEGFYKDMKTKINTRVFKSTNGLLLIIKSRKSAVILEMSKDQLNDKHDVVFDFAPGDFVELLNYFEHISNECWTNLIPKEANSLGSDYYEYYDRELDNNGYLSIRENGLAIDRPFLDSPKLYQFNKKKMESFIYDFRRMTASAQN